MFQVSFTKPRWLKSPLYPHLVKFVYLTPDLWTMFLLVDFRPTIVDGISICVLCFYWWTSDQPLSMVSPYVCYVSTGGLPTNHCRWYLHMCAMFLLVDFRPTIVDGISICVLCFYWWTPDQPLSMVSPYVCYVFRYSAVNLSSYGISCCSKSFIVWYRKTKLHSVNCRYYNILTQTCFDEPTVST